MHIDFKITTWERLEIPAELASDVMDAISSGKITSANEVLDHFDYNDGFSVEKLDDLDEQMTVNENGGSSTIEVFDSSQSEPTWKNGE